MALDWILFALAVAVIGAIGIAIGLFIAGRATRWGDRRSAEKDNTFMTEGGPPAGTDGAVDGAAGESAGAGASGAATDD
jgi:hypothetical protein